MGTNISVTIGGGAFNAYKAAPAKLPAPAIVVLHEAFGVNPDIRKTCDELAGHGFLAVAPDLYWRLEPDLQLSPIKDWERGIALYQRLDLDAAVKDAQALVDWLRKSKETTGEVGVTGFCLGGLMTYLIAARGGVDAGVCYYGGRTDEFLNEAPNVRGPLLMHLGEKDEFISPTAQTAIKRALNGEDAEIHVYPNCSHAFARHSGAHYDHESALRANARTVAFFREHLET